MLVMTQSGGVVRGLTAAWRDKRRYAYVTSLHISPLPSKCPNNPPMCDSVPQGLRPHPWPGTIKYTDVSLPDTHGG